MWEAASTPELECDPSKPWFPRLYTCYCDSCDALGPKQRKVRQLRLAGIISQWALVTRCLRLSSTVASGSLWPGRTALGWRGWLWGSFLFLKLCPPWGTPRKSSPDFLSGKGRFRLREHLSSSP